MRLTENYKFGKRHFSLESVRTEIIQKRGIGFHDDDDDYLFSTAKFNMCMV